MFNLKRSKVMLRAAVATMAAGTVLATAPGLATADSTDNYPIPNRILKTTCTVDQYMAAARDTSPVYYERYMIDYNNRPLDVQQGARDRIYWFFSLDYPGRRRIRRTPRPTSTTSRWPPAGVTGRSCSSTTRVSWRTRPMCATSTPSAIRRCGPG